MSDREDVFSTVIMTPEGLRDKFVTAYRHAETMLRNGSNVLVSVGPSLEPITVLQRKFLHGPVLGQISEQARIVQYDSHGQPTGKTERYVVDVWKEHYAERFLGYRFEMRRGFVLSKVSGAYRPAKKATPHRVRVSSETLGVRRYSEWIDQIIDHAVVEFDVQFVFKPSEREAVRFVDRGTRRGRSQ